VGGAADVLDGREREAMNTHQVIFLLLDLALVLILAGVFGAIARRLGQPPVVGEIFAGILIGPTLLHGAIARTFFPVDVRPLLSALASVGVAMFMFLIGMDLGNRALRGQRSLTISVSLAAAALPFGLGTMLAQLLTHHQPPGQRLGFTLFMGAAMSVTAFPVLARIITDRGMSHTRVGRMALASAAVDDVLAWSMLAVVITLAGGQEAPWRVLLIIPYTALVLLVGRPLLQRLLQSDTVTNGRFAFVLAGLLLSGAFTEWMGLHFIFGAFLFGVAMPREGAESLRHDIKRGLERVSGVLLLPVFFVVAGLQVNLSQVDLGGLGELGLIMLVAVGGKFTGAFVAARAHGVHSRQAAALASLMNTRGLTEVVVLTIGLNLGMLNTTLYSLMMVMALVTTAMTGPLLQLVYPQRYAELEQLEATDQLGAAETPAPAASR
jgi:Kef-type K+ transport system membrane component KefB